MSGLQRRAIYTGSTSALGTSRSAEVEMVWMDVVQVNGDPRLLVVIA